MPPTLFTDDLSFGGNTSGLLDCSTDALDELQPADAGVPSSPVKAQLSRATKARPSWGPPSTATAKNFQGTRLLDGLPEPPHWPPKESQDPGGPDASASQTSTSASAAGSSTAGSKLRLGGIERGGKGKPRFSLFAKPVYAPAKRTVSGAGSSASGASAAPALPALMDDVPMPLADDVDVTADGPSESAAPLPTRDEYINEIAQLRALNNVFSGYDAMLQGTAEHIDTVASRVHDINQLLDVYIDFLRRSQQIHTLLTDPTWQGISEEGRLHDEAVSAAADAAAQRQAEAEAKRQEEEARRLAQQEAARKRAEAAASSNRLGSRRPGTRGRGGRAASGPARPVQTRSALGKSATTGRPSRATPSAARPGGPPSRSSATTAATSAPGAGKRASGIPRPSVASGRYGHIPASGYGRR